MAELPALLTQELGNDVNRLAPQEELPVAPAVAGEALLAARALLLQVDKIRRHVVILGDNRTPCGGLKQGHQSHGPYCSAVPAER